MFYGGINFFYFPLETTFADESRFIASAITLAQTGEFWVSDNRAFEMPLTAILYAFFYAIVGDKENLIIVVRIFQSLCLILQAFICYKLSLRIFGNELVAKCTFIAILFYPYFIFYQALLLSETIFITLLVIAFYYIYEWYASDFEINFPFLYANLFLVLTIYTKGTLSILPPFLLIAFYFLNRFSVIGTLKIAVLSLLLYGTFMSFWWIRNAQIFNQFVPFTTSSSLVLYVGNNPNNKDNSISPFISISDAMHKEMAKRNELSRSDLLKQEAIKFMVNHPDELLKLMYLKFKRFYTIIPNAEGYDSGLYKWVSILSYGIILPLFIGSIFWHIRSWQKLSAIYMLFLYFTLIHIIFLASLRYRLPLEPFMIVLAMPFFIDIYNKFFKGESSRESS